MWQNTCMLHPVPPSNFFEVCHRHSARAKRNCSSELAQFKPSLSFMMSSGASKWTKHSNLRRSLPIFEVISQMILPLRKWIRMSWLWSRERCHVTKYMHAATSPSIITLAKKWEFKIPSLSSFKQTLDSYTFTWLLCHLNKSTKAMAYSKRYMPLSLKIMEWLVACRNVFARHTNLVINSS